MQLRKATIYEYPEEFFVPIPETDGLYECNCMGIVRNSKSKKIIKHFISNGYLYVPFKINGKTKSRAVHRIVGLLFVDNPENKKCLNHKDGDKLNPAHTNLEWVTYSENERHSFDVLGKQPVKAWIGAYNELNPNAKSIDQYTKEGSLVRSYPSLSEAGRCGFTVSKISAVCHGVEKSHKGFVFKFSNSKN